MTKEEKLIRLDFLNSKVELTDENFREIEQLEISLGLTKKDLNSEPVKKLRGPGVLIGSFILGCAVFFTPAYLWLVNPGLKTASPDDDVSILIGIVIFLGTVACGFLSLALFKNKRF